MSAGETFWFAGYLENVFDDQSADFGSTPHGIKCALITGYTPTGLESNPTWGGGGTDLSAYEVTAGGEYTAGGNTCASPNSSRTSNVFKLDWANPAAWAQDGANPSNARWAIFYDTTNLDCICFYDLGTTRDMTTGELLITMGTPALSATIATP